MIIQAVSRRHIGGVTKKKGQQEWTSDSRSVGHLPKQQTLKFLVI
jgi:hypothetical protein